MSTSERRTQILRLLQSHGGLSIRELSAMVFTSAASVRRDVIALEEEGLVRRVYGGVLLSTSDNAVVPLSVRDSEHSAQKERLARRAAELVEDGDTILLDASSTVRRMIRHLHGLRDLTIITNNDRILHELDGLNAHVLCTGGEYLRENHAFAGPAAEAFVRGVWADKLFFSSQGLSQDGEVSDHSEIETALRRAMLERSAHHYCLMDDSKIGRRCRFRLCSQEDIDQLICEKKLPWQ